MDVSQYLEIFIDESEEHLQTLSDCIMVLEKEPDNKDTINEVFRAAHSLKGMAGTMGFKRMQHLTHDMENVFQEVRSDNVKTVMYQVRKLKGINTDTEWHRLMIKKWRKTLAVCKHCNANIHAHDK